MLTHLRYGNDLCHRWEQQIPDFLLTREYEVFGGCYRVDFAYLLTKTRMELDGYDFHSDHDTFIRDR